MPNRISTEPSTLPQSPAGGGAVPAHFDAPELARVWNGFPPLGNGARGEGVRLIQALLAEFGFDAGAVDGIMGPRTASALGAFQKAKGLPPSGKIDQGTLKALDQALSPNRVSNPNAPKADGKLDNARFANKTQLGRVLTGELTLGNGSKGDGVKVVQQALDDMGFAVYGGADGVFGGQTEKAVKNFQRHAARMFPEVKATGTLDAATLKALDALAPKPGQKGQQSNLPNPRFGGRLVRVVVVKEEHRTYLFDKQGKLQDIVPNAVGAVATTTESGLKKVTGKLNEKQAIAVGQKLWGGPVFGARIIDLSWADGSHSGEELHGTNAPQHLGEDVSHGCMRHDNKDIIKLYDALKVGDLVAVVDRLDDPRLGTPIR